MTKIDLIDRVLKELRRAQHEHWIPPREGPVKRIRLPPALPLEGKGNLPVTENLLSAVAAYSRIWADNEPSLKKRFKAEELADLAGRAFADILSTIDLDRPDSELRADVRHRVDTAFSTRTRFDNKPLDVTLGCHLLKGDDAYPLRVGPVLFETRDQWRVRSLKAGRLSTISNRRLEKAWSGARLRKRTPSLDENIESSVIDAVGECPVVCTIETDGLSSKMIQEKAVVAARLAMTAISLMWNRPSAGLNWMNLVFDGKTFQRHYTLFSAERYVGSSSSISQMPSGRWTDAELLAELQEYQSLFNVLGDAIRTFVQPNASNARPTINNSIFLSLWWLQAGCREAADQIATTKFVASMDALAKGDNAHAVLRFLKARAKYEANTRLMTDGRTAKNVLTDLYNSRRSQLLHGSSMDFAHDWSGARSTAEAVARLCLVLACGWIEKHPNTDDLEALSKA